MSKKTVTPQQNADIIARGCCASARSFVRMTSGYTVHDYGVESFLVHACANALFRFYQKMGLSVSVFPELPLREIKEDAGASNKGPLGKALAGRSRIDLMLYGDDQKPLGAIEFKRSAHFHNIQADVKRVSVILDKFGRSRGGSVRFVAVPAFGK